jgi:hypothetical protein
MEKQKAQFRNYFSLSGIIWQNTKALIKDELLIVVIRNH